MMLFKPEHIRAILLGAKTESRRMWNAPRVKVGSLHQIKDRIYTKDHFGYIEITGLRKEHLLDITPDGAYREGMYSRDYYLELFHRIYPKAGENPELYVVSFKLSVSSLDKGK